MPIAIKDLIVLTEGLRTANASRALGEWAPDVDSAPVARLRAAGAIIVGKTNTPEWGMRPVTEPERYGPARNPHDPALTPGGSSGGSAAAVAAGLVALAHGNDAGGSIRIPASCCGVVGLKPTRFRVPLGPELRAFEGFGVDGVLTRTVLDTALALDLLAGDGPSTPLGPPLPHPPFAEAAMLPPHPLRIRLCTTPPGGEEVEPECVAAAHHAAGLLQSLGHEVDEWEPDWARSRVPRALDERRSGDVPRARRALRRAERRTARPGADGARHARGAGRADQLGGGARGHRGPQALHARRCSAPGTPGRSCSHPR